MATALPFPLILPTVPAPAGVTPAASIAGPAGSAESGAIGVFDFAALMAAQIGGANLPSTAVLATINDVVAETPAIIASGVPEQPPSEDALIQAAGGADTSAASAEQAVAAAIESGIVPVPSERLVLATALPTVVQTAASVNALDRLLDKLSGPVPAGLTHMVKQLTSSDANGIGTPEHASIGQSPNSNYPTASSTIHRLGEAVEARATHVHDALRSAVDSALQNHLRAALIDPAGVIESASPTAMDPAGAPHQPNVLGTLTKVQAPTVPGVPVTPPSFARVPDLSNSGGPADTPGTPRGRGEPAAFSNGKSSATALEVLQQRFTSLGVDADIWTTIERVTAEARVSAPTSAPATVASPGGPQVAAALSNAVHGMLVTRDGPGALNASGAHAMSSGLADTLTANTNGSSTGRQSGNGGGFENFGAAIAPSGETGFLTQDSSDSSFGFSTLLANQIGASGAPRAVNTSPPVHPPLPPVPPDQIAVHIAEAARNGARNITIQLRPAALGRIEVELSVGRDGNVRSRILAERSETLDLLQRDARGLERALEAAGLRAETGGLSFGLKDGSQHGHKTFDQAFSQTALLTSGDEQESTTPLPVYHRAASDSRTLDIKV